MSGGPNTTGPKNGWWKGGRSLASNGYVLVRVGTDHHLADVRGYAYEHRVVAEKIIGRRLRPGELVHHKNGDKTDNRPENLEVMPSAAHHQKEHRKPGRTGLRDPGEENPIVTCACGCGGRFYRYDTSGRRRTVISGHNQQPSPKKDAIFACLSSAPASIDEIVEKTGLLRPAVRTCLSKLKNEGLATSDGRGNWRLR